MNKLLEILIVASVLRIGYSKFQERTLALLFKKAVEKNVTSQKCTQSLSFFMEKLYDMKNASEDLWPLKMLEATGRIPQDILSYNSEDMGNFKQCISLRSHYNSIEGKYCLGDLYLNSTRLSPEEYNIVKEEVHLMKRAKVIDRKIQILFYSNWAFCIPSNCSDEDAMHLMNSFQISRFEVASVTCQTYHDAYPDLSTSAIFGLAAFGFLIFIVILSTCCDVYRQRNKKGPGHLLIAFSVYTNGKKLFEMPRRYSNLSCLDGMKVLSMFWIVILHVNSGIKNHPVSNSIDVVIFGNSIFSIFLDSAGLACDSFFVITGLLLTYGYFRKENMENLTTGFILKHYLHRYIRLVSVLAGLVLFSATLLKYIGSGPTWPIYMNTHLGHCESNWWLALLLIQNVVDQENMCLMHTWYVDVDMQLYLFSPLLFFLLKNYTKSGIALISIAAFASLALTFFRMIQNKFGDLTDYYQTMIFIASTNKVYYKTETRITPWLMGSILGYVLTKKPLKNVRLSKKSIVPLWILSLIIMICCVFGGHDSLVSTKHARIQNALYITLSRPLFSLAVVWVIWACSTNHGGIVNTVLSLPIFQFLNKFAYSVYLLHFIITFSISGAAKTPIYLDFFNLAYWFWGVFIFSLIVSIPWILLFESPMINLERIIFASK